MSELSGDRFRIHYRIAERGAAGQALARALCVDQTVELSDALIPPGFVRQHMVGRLEHVTRCAVAEGYDAVVSFAVEMVKHDVCQFLNIMFGMCSLKSSVRVIHVEIPPSLRDTFPGARFGRHGLRAMVGCFDRPLVCGVLKPLGLSARELASLAARFAEGGLDMIKDDQALGDHAWCRFEDRVARCADAVHQVNRRNGRRCVYFANVTGPGETLQKRCRFAKEAGAGGLMICPGLTGFDGIQRIVRDEQLALPVLSHPAFLGSFIHSPTQGIAPNVLFGELPRALGADVSVYPLFGSSYRMDREEWLKTREACLSPWGTFQPVFPTVAGRLGEARVREFTGVLATDSVYVVGGELQRDKNDIVGTCRRFVRLVSELATEES